MISNHAPAHRSKSDFCHVLHHVFLCARWTAGHWGCCCMPWCTAACHLTGPATPRSQSRSAKAATADPTPPQVNPYSVHVSISITFLFITVSDELLCVLFFSQCICYKYPLTLFPPDACALIDWLLTVRVDERATIEDVANHWWVNWGFEESVCDCPSSPHQECPSPLLARYIDWQNRGAAASNMTVDPGCLSSDSSCPPHPFYFSLPLKSDRGGGGGGRVRGGMSSLRKSRKENAIPQTAMGACGGVCATAASSAAISVTSTAERKKPKGILKPQRSFDSVFHNPPKENSPSQPCNAAPQPCRTHTHADVLSTSLPPPSTFSQPSSKMPKKGILKNLYGGESGYGSSSERRISGAGVKESDAGDLCSHNQHTCLPAADDSPTMRTEAVRRRKGILKRNGKFSRSLDLPDDHHSTLSSAPTIFPEALQQLLQATGGAEGRRSRPSSVVSEDSLFSSDSFDLLDLSAQSRRRIFSRVMQHSGCSSEENLEQLRGEAHRAGGDEEGQKEMLT